MKRRERSNKEMQGNNSSLSHKFDSCFHFYVGRKKRVRQHNEMPE